MGGRARPQRARPKRPGPAPTPAVEQADKPAKPKSTFPRRDADGHVAYFRDLVGVGVGGTLAWALGQVLAGDTALLDGMAGVTAAMLVYAPVWFYGIRFVE